MSYIIRRRRSLDSSGIASLFSKCFHSSPIHFSPPLRGLISISSVQHDPSKTVKHKRLNGNPAFLMGIPGLFPSSAKFRANSVRFSTSSAAAEAVDWNPKKWPVDANGESGLEAQHKEHGTYITVKAYLLCTSVDLKGLQSERLFDVVPPNSRIANYVILRCTDNMPDYSCTAMRTGMEARTESWSNHRHMVVFQYGSIVFFNFADQEEEGYLQIVKKYASGLLSETRKDDDLKWS